MNLTKKSVRIRYIIEVDVPVLADYATKEDVEFHRNESTWCASNLLDELRQLDAELGCLCSRTTCEFVHVNKETL